jgi:hypothetical protein
VRAYGLWPGELNCYHTSSRARLFARLQGSVTSIFDLRNLLDYNAFQKDPESVGDACEVHALFPPCVLAFVDCYLCSSL